MRIAVITIDHRQPTAIIQKLFDVADLTSQDRRYIVAETLADTELIRHSSEDRRCLSIHSLIGTSSLKHFLVIVASFVGLIFLEPPSFFRDDLLFENGIFIKIFSLSPMLMVIASKIAQSSVFFRSSGSIWVIAFQFSGGRMS